MDRKLLDYLPPVLREVLEFQAISGANEPELSLAWDALTLVLANQFLETADTHGVAIWEKELKIFPKDTDTLAERKARIKALWGLEMPYTTPWLKNWLTSICGLEGHEETIADYTIHIQLDYTALPNAGSLAEEILNMLLAVRPCNMRVLLAAFLQSCGAVSLGAAAEMGQTVDVYPRIVQGLEMTASAIMTGALEYRAYLDIYPREDMGYEQ